MRTAWCIATILTGIYALAVGLGLPPQQAGHPGWATAIAVLSLQAVTAVIVWVMLDERRRRC